MADFRLNEDEAEVSVVTYGVRWNERRTLERTGALWWLRDVMVGKSIVETGSEDSRVSSSLREVVVCRAMKYVAAPPVTRPMKIHVVPKKTVGRMPRSIQNQASKK